jgi:CDP-diacylglycerol--glycerol-3-phosphate 3-phosphatidyltransferase
MNDHSFVSPEFRARVRLVAVPIALALGKLGLTPNALTIVGFLGTCLAAIAAANQAWVLAGILVIVFGIFDLFDGALARATGQTSTFGAFLDSTLDRTGESLVLAGVAYGCAAAGFALGAGLAATAIALASVVTYARAKAEVIGLRGDIGIAPRPERLLILAVGLVITGLLGGIEAIDCGNLDCITTGSPVGQWTIAIALGVIAVLSAITIIQRILHVRKQLNTTTTR